MQYTHVAPVDKLASRLRRHLEAAAKHFPPSLVADRPHLAEALARFHGEMIDAAVAALESLEVVPAEAVADALTASRMDALMRELAESLPPVCGGGGPDDFEEVSAEFLDDPEGWPAFPDPEADGWVYELGPTPIEVLARDEPTWEPSDADWDDMFRMSGAPLTEADHMVVHGCV